MLKRSNKIIALLVAATSIMSIVPAMAADSTRLGTKDGTIESAVAFKDGKYVYEGYKSDDNDRSLYYYSGQNDKQLDDIEDADLQGTFADKYAFAKDGSDEYLVDLTSGSVVDDDTPEDITDTAATKLKTALKKTDRYGNSVAIDSTNDLTKLNGFKFGEVWYQYGVTTTSSDAVYNLISGKLYGYTNTSGKYIDISNLANVYAYSSAKKKVVKIEEFNKADTDTKLKAELTAAPTYLTQDKDYIYQKVTVKITDTNTVTQTPATTQQLADAATAISVAQNAFDTAVTSQLGALNTSLTTAQGTLTAAQGVLTTDQATLETVRANTNSTVADINAAQATVDSDQAAVTAAETAVTAAQTSLNNAIANSVTLSALKVTLDSAKAEQTRLQGLGSSQAVAPRTTTYIQKISKAQGDKKDDAFLPKSVTSYELSRNFYDSKDADDAYDADADATSYQVINGTLYTINNTGSNVKVTSLNLKKDKVKFESGLPANFNSSDKMDVYLVEKSDDDDTDITRTESVSIDVDGNIWAINKGKIYKFENNKFVEKYTCDRSLDTLDIYDSNNLIAWENNGDVYTTVTEGTQDNSTPATPVIKTGWQQDGANWYFNDATGTKVVNKWINAGGAWYYLKADGVMATGWLNDNGTWYYLNASGAMKTGWLNDNGTWYYLASSGAMKTGWVNDNGTWYYLNASGAMLANTTVDGYKLGASGAWIR